MLIVVTYNDGSSERIEGPTQWDVQKDGHLIAWNDERDVIAERDDVATALPDRLRG